MSEKNFNHWTRFDARFNLCSSEVEACIRFILRSDAPICDSNGKRLGFFHAVLPLDVADQVEPEATALEAAEAALAHSKTRWIDTGREKLEALVTYLESTERQDALDAAKWCVADLEEQAARLAKRIEAAKSDLAEIEESAP